jgi:hypothetical protein
MKEEKIFNLFSEDDTSDNQLQRLMQLVAVDVRERMERAKRTTHEALHAEITKVAESTKQTVPTHGK